MKLLIDTLGEILSGLFNFLADGFGSLVEDKSSDNNASFGDPDKLISGRHKGWCVDGRRFLDMESSRKNFCVVAGSGKGKSQVHIFPTILNSESSMVVNDNSSELTTTIPYLTSKGITPLVLNLTQKCGVYLNPLDGCQGDVSAMRKISKTLMGNASKENDFFSLSAEDCITLFIQYVLESEPKVYQNLGNVYRLILEYQGSPRVVERLMAKRASESVWKKFKSLAGSSEKTLKSILATALSGLSWLGDNPILTDITSVSNISFEDFRKSPHCLFIQSPVSDIKFYAPMVALVFQSFYRFAFSKLPAKNDLDIMMVYDEFSSLIEGLPDYSSTISNSRKFKIPQCLILQDESQLSPYKELKENILQNCFVKCYYGGQDKKSFELEKLLGEYEYTDKETKQKKRIPLMSASQIREMDKEIIVLPNGQKPLKVKITPAYKQRRLRKQLSMVLPENQDEIPTEFTIQYINLDEFKSEDNEADN